jgi:hypothetical protein
VKLLKPPKDTGITDMCSIQKPLLASLTLINEPLVLSLRTFRKFKIEAIAGLGYPGMPHHHSCPLSYVTLARNTAASSDVVTSHLIFTVAGTVCTSYNAKLAPS